MRRFQIYYRLVDISFAITALWLVLKVIGGVFPGVFKQIPLFGEFWAVAFPVNILCAVVLVLARRMRDEHAERVWQDTARRFVNFIMVAPMLTCFAIAFFIKDINKHAADVLPTGMVAILRNEPDHVITFIGGFAATMVLTAVLVPQLFILFYRWGLWRDSR